METLTLRHKSLLDDEEFYRFCQENDELRIERDAHGFIQVMANTGGTTGRRNLKLAVRLGLWNEKAHLRRSVRLLHRLPPAQFCRALTRCGLGGA